MTQQEIDELFEEFIVRLEEKDHEDKVRIAKNCKAMRGVTAYFKDTIAPMNEVIFDEKGNKKALKYYGLQSTYLKLREVIPNLVMTKKHRFKVRNYYDIHERKEYGKNPTLKEEDADEATKAGKILLDAMMRYLTDDET